VGFWGFEFGLDTPNDDTHRLLNKEDLVEIIKYILKSTTD